MYNSPSDNVFHVALTTLAMNIICVSPDSHKSAKYGNYTATDFNMF